MNNSEGESVGTAGLLREVPQGVKRWSVGVKLQMIVYKGPEVVVVLFAIALKSKKQKALGLKILLITLIRLFS
jgi:hypothetical protein